MRIQTRSSRWDGQPLTIDGEKLDKYQRLVAKVVVQGTDCGLKQITEGLAWHFKGT